jgi:hypothetical protein
MVATVFSETLHPFAFMVGEEENFHCRDSVVIAISQTIRSGMVLGKKAVAANVTSGAAAAAGNTGNGTFTLDVTNPVSAAVQDGVYEAICIEPGTNLGTFEVFDPSGVSIGTVVVGATFNNQIKFVIADGATDFVSGDRFLITVGVEYDSDMQYAAHDPAATDGTQNACAIAGYPVTTDGSTTKKIAAIVRGPAQARLADLEFKSGITAAQKAEVLDQLRALGIVAR